MVDVRVALPEEALHVSGIGPQEAAEEMRRLFVLDQYRRGRISCGKAAEMAEMSLAHFFTYMAQHGVSPFTLDEEELQRELEWLS